MRKTVGLTHILCLFSKAFYYFKATIFPCNVYLLLFIHFGMCICYVFIHFGKGLNLITLYWFLRIELVGASGASE